MLCAQHMIRLVDTSSHLCSFRSSILAKTIQHHCSDYHKALHQQLIIGIHPQHIQSVRKKLHDQNTYDGPPKSSLSTCQRGASNHHCCNCIRFISLPCGSHPGSYASSRNNSRKSREYACNDIDRTNNFLVSIPETCAAFRFPPTAKIYRPYLVL